MATTGASRRPHLGWEAATDAALVGMALADETQDALVWDAAGQLQLFDRCGTSLACWQAPTALITADISADGSTIVAGVGPEHVAIFNRHLQTPHVLHLGMPPCAVAVDEQGWYFAVSTSDSVTHLLDRHGRELARCISQRPLQFLLWLSEVGCIVGAAETGLLEAWDFQGRSRWQHRITSRVGGLSAHTAGKPVVAAAFHEGVLRFDANGTRRPAFSQPHPVSRVAAAAHAEAVLWSTLDGGLTCLERGQAPCIWQATDEVVAVALAPLGGSVWVAERAGRIARWELSGLPSNQEQVAISPARATGLRPHDWAARIPGSDAGISALAVAPDAQQLAALNGAGQLVVWRPALAPLVTATPHLSSPVPGVGRVLLAGERRFMVLSSLRLLVYDTVDNRSQFTPARFVEPTHVRALGGRELLIIEERDRVSRAWLDGQREWTWQAPACVQQWAVGTDRFAVLTDGGELFVRGLDGAAVLRLKLGVDWLIAACGDGFLLIDPAPARAQWLEPTGNIAWERSLPFCAWRVETLGRLAVVCAADGQACLVSAAGEIRIAAPPHEAETCYFRDARGRARRLFRQAGTLFCGSLSGRTEWRCTPPAHVDAWAADAGGVALACEGQILWYAPRAGSEQAASDAR